MARWQGHMLGRYRLLRMLGHGGMGEVWLAEDSELHRQVAIKLLPPVLSQEQDYLRTFAEEAHMVAALEHPNILPVHDFGEVLQGDDIITYLVMPVINGGSLRDRIKGSSDLLSAELSLKFLHQAASAIDYAHSQRVLHRDIKPGNMLLQDDWLYLADFGLAKLLSTSTYRSRTHAGAGTPEYMAPEQARGKAVGASDLYSLTIIAYQFFTGRLPFRGDNPFSVMIQHLKDEVPSLRQFNPQLSEEIERVILKGLSKQSQERYPSSRAFVDALIHAWQNSTQEQQPLAFSLVDLGGKIDEPITPPTASSRSTISTMVISAGNAMTPQVPSHSLETPQPPATDQQVTVTTPEKQKPERKVRRRTFLFGGVASTVLLTGGGLSLASSWFGQVKRSDPQRFISGVPIIKLTGHIDVVWSALWNPQRRYLATGGDDTNIMLWDIEKYISAPPSSKLKVVAQPDAYWRSSSPVGLNNLTWSPDGSKLATISDNGNHTLQEIHSTLLLIDAFMPDATPVADMDDQAAHVSDLYSYPTWSPRGDVIATVRLDSNTDKDNRSIALWLVGDKAQGPSSTWKNVSKSRVPSINFVEIIALDWSCNGAQLAGIDGTYTLLFWDAQTGKQSLFPLPGRAMILETDTSSGSYLPSLSSSPVDPTRFVVHDVDVAMLVDSQQKKVLRTLGSNFPAVNKTSDTQLTRSATPSQFAPCMGHLAWSPDGRYIASSYLNSSQIFIWDLANARPKQTNKGIQLPDLTFGQNSPQSGVITYLDWSPDGRYIATASTDGSVVIWLVDGTT